MTPLIILLASTITVLLLIILTLSLTNAGKTQGRLDEIARQVSGTADLKHTIDTITSLHKDIGAIAAESKKITQIDAGLLELKNLFMMPSQAGLAGQNLLDKALSDMLGGDFYKAQYPFSVGRADYVLIFKDCLIPLDSKLSLENFKKSLAATDQNQKRAYWKSFCADVKRRIDETSKYILPKERTTDFAFMYVASEAVYYEAFVRPQQFGEENTLHEYAIKKKVFPVSPQTLTPFLNTIVVGLKALAIEESARQICNKIAGLHNEIDKFRQIYSTIRGHIADANNRLNDGAGKLDTIDQHIEGLQIKEG